MADAMDTRIVEMQFNNKDFEKNISVSQKSLEKFKKELNFDETSRGLENFSKSIKNVDFSTMENNIQALTDKFTGLGHVGEYVLSRIRRTLEGMGDQVMSFVNSLTTVQVSAGFTKYESLNKSVQTLKSATHKEEKEIYAVLERLTKYTDETSYDFAQGVTSISQLVSSGAATLEQAERTVEGFYNYAAKAGADTQKAAQALNFSFVQAMQKGYLDWMNAKELSNRSLLTLDFKKQLLEEAVAVGTLTKENGKYYVMSKKGRKAKKIEVNATNLFNDSLKQQWATAKVLNGVMAKYQDTSTEFGNEAYKAAQRCTTFTDALNAWKDMLSTGWMTTYRTVFGDLTESMALFSSICNKVSEALSGLVNTRNKILNAWKEMGGRDSLMGMLFGELEDPDSGKMFEGAYGILDIITKIGDMISEGWWNMVMNLMPKNEQQQLLDFVNSNIDALNAQLIKQGQEDLVITKPFESFEEFWNSDFAKGTGLREGAFGGGLNEATQNVQKFVESLHTWFNEPLDNKGTTRLQRLQTVINAVINTISFGFQIVGAIFDFFGMIGDQLQPSFDAIGEMFAALFGNLEQGEVAASNSSGLTAFFTNLAEILRPVTSAINGIVSAVARLVTALFTSKEAGEGASTVWEAIKNVLKGVWAVIKAIAGPIVTFVTTVINSLAELFENGVTEENIAIFKENIKTAFSTMLEGIKTGITPILDKIKDFLVNLWATVSATIGGYFADENTFGHKALQWIMGFVNKLKNGLKTLFPGATEAIKGFFSNLIGSVQDTENDGGLFNGIKNFGMKFVERFRSLFSNGLVGGFKEIGKSISTLFKNLFVVDEINEQTGKSMTFLERLKNLLIAPGSLGEGILILFGKIRDWWNGLNGETKALIVIAIPVIMIIRRIVKAFQTIAEGWLDLSSVIKKGFGQSDEKTFAKKMLMIGGAVALLTASIYTIGHMDLGQGIQGLIGVAAILATLWGFCKLMKKVVKDMSISDFAKITLGVISISIAIRKIVNALLPIAKIKDRSELANMGLALLGITAAIAALMYVSKFSNFKMGTGIGLILFAVSVGILVDKLIEIFGDSGKAQALQNALQIMQDNVLAIVGLGAGIWMAGQGLNQFLQPLAKIILSVAALAVSVAILIIALKQVADVNPKQFIKMGAVLITVLGSIFLFVAAMGKLKNNKGLKDSDLWQLIGLAAAIAGLILALQLVANMKWEQLGKMGAAFGGVMIGLIGMIITVNKTAGEHGRGMKKSGLLGVIGLALGIAGLILALQMVANMEWGQLGRMGATFGVVILGLIAMIVAINKTASENGRGFKGAGIFLGLTAVVLGIAGLVLALKTVANLKWEELAKMLITFGVLMIGIRSLIKAIGDSSDESGRGFKGAAMFAGMFALFYGIERLIHYMMPLTKMRWPNLLKLWISIAVIFGSITSFVKNIPENIDFGTAFNTTLAMAGFIGAVWAMIEVLKPLANFSAGSLTKMGTGLVVISLVLVKATKSLTGLISESESINGGEILKVFAVMAGFIGAIWGLIEVLTPLGKLSVGSLLKMGTGLVLLSIMLTTVTKSMMKLAGASGETGGGDILKVVGMMAGFIAGIWGLIQALSPLAGFSWGSLAKMSLGLILLSIVLTTATKSMMKLAGNSGETAWKDIGKVLAMMAGVSVAMVVLSYSLSKIKNVKTSTILAFTIGLSAMMLAMSVSMKMLSTATPAGVLIGLVALVGGIAAIMGVIGLIGPWMFESIGKSLGVFGEGLGSLGEALEKFSNATSGTNSANIDASLDLIHGIAKVQLALTGENISLAVFSKFTGEKIDKGNLKEFGENMAALGGFVASFCASIKDSNFDNVDKATGAITAIAAVQRSLTEENIELAVFSKLLGVSIKPGNIVGFTNDILAVAPMLKTIGNTLSETSFENFGKAAEAMNKIAEVKEKLTFDNIELAIFSKLIGKDIQPGNLTDFISDVMAVAPMLKIIGDSFNLTDFANFGTAAEALNKLSTARSTLTFENIELAIFSKLIGVDIKPGDLVGFINDIKAVVPMLEIIGASFTKTDFSNFGKAADAMNTVADVKGALTWQNISLAVFSKLIGRKIKEGDIRGFGDDILAIAPTLSDVSEKLKDCSFENVTKAAEALRAFAEVQGVLSNQGIKEALANAVLDIFGSDNEVEAKDLEDFGNDLVPLGEAMAKFAKSVTYIDMGNGKLESIDTDGFKAAVNAIGVLTELQKVLPNIEGVFDWITTRKMTLPEFADGLQYLGEGIRNIHDKIYELKDGNAPTPEDIQHIATMIESLSSILMVAKYGDVSLESLRFDKITTELQDIIDLSSPTNATDIERMTGLLSAMASAAAEMKGLRSIDNLYDTLEEMVYDTKLQEQLKTMGESLATNLASGIDNANSYQRVSNALRSLMRQVTSSGAGTMFYDTLSLEDLINANLDADIEESSIQDIVAIIDSKFENASEKEEWSFRDVGYYMAAGIAVGVSQGTYLIENACRAAVAAARVAAMDEADEHSPSVVFMKIGEFLSSGMAIGISNGQKDVVDAATGMTGDAVSGAADAVSAFASLMSQEIDVDPTITPIVDMTNITAAGATLDQMMGERNLELSANGNQYVRESIPGNAQNTSEYRAPDLSWIKESIANLGNQITVMGNKISNMQIVLDSGRLVGAVTDGVNKNLGSKTIYRRRRN